jgi:hypothetical protein
MHFNENENIRVKVFELKKRRRGTPFRNFLSGEENSLSTLRSFVILLREI